MAAGLQCRSNAQTQTYVSAPVCVCIYTIPYVYVTIKASKRAAQPKGVEAARMQCLFDVGRIPSAGSSFIGGSGLGVRVLGF